MSFLKKIFGDRSAAKAPTANVERRSSTPAKVPAADGQRKSIKCDLCSAATDQGSEIANQRFRESVERGFNPIGITALRARMLGFVQSGIAKGLTEAQMSARWTQGALADGTDWILCDACHSDYAAATERKNRAFSSDFFWKGLGAASMLAESHGQSLVLDSFSLVVREALEEILAEHLNSGRWDSLPFSQWGTKPYLPGQMVFSLQMAERPQSDGLHDAYVVPLFSLGLPRASG